MSENDRADYGLTMDEAVRRTKVFGIKSMTVLMTASMLLSGVPTAAIAEELEEQGVITAEQPTDQGSTGENTEGQTAETTRESGASEQAPSSDQGSNEQTQQPAQQSASTETSSAPAQEQAVADVADVALELNNASISYNGQTIANPATKVTLPTNSDFKFAVTPDSGYDLNEVTLTVAGNTSELKADASGTYTVAATDVAQAPKVTLETEQQKDAEAVPQAIALENTGDEGDASSDASTGCSISGDAAVTMGESITLTFEGPEGSKAQGWADNSGAFDLTVAEDGQSVVATAKTGWVFNGTSKDCNIVCWYTDAQGVWHTGDAQLAKTVKVNKRTFKVVAPDVVNAYGSHYVFPTLIDAATGEEVAWTGEAGDAFTFNYYKDGEYICNQSLMKSDGAKYLAALTGPGEYTVEVVPNDGYYYAGKSQTVKIDEEYTKPADTETDKYIYVGDTLEIEGTDAAYHRWTYEESDVLSVSVEKSKRAETNKATVTGLKVGDVTLKHESSSTNWFWPVTTDTITVHVIKKAPAASLTISGPDTVEQDKSITLTTDAETDVTWTSSDPSIATVDANGKVTGVKEGTVTITATTVTAEGKVLTATHDVKVTKSETSGKYNAKFTSTIENADVVYFNWHNASDASNVTFTPATSSFTVNDYTTDTASGYVVFFVKPNSNHIITGLGASGAGQMYAVDATSWGAINGYPGISTVMAAAKAEGYVAAFGYSRGPKSNMAQSFEVRAKSPDMLIAATSSQTEGVAAGDELTFTVTITPQTTGSGKDHATGVKVNSAEVNGTEVTVENLTQNSDGTYTGYVHYTATDNDCNRGSVVLSVEATTTYEGTFTITSGGITTGAEVTKSATCACQIAPESQVKYQFVSGTTGMALPSAINDFLPWDNNSYNANKTVKAKDPSQTEYVDSKNDGYWTFSGWDHDSVTTKRSGDTVTFTGTWVFTKYSKYTINYVDENGNKIAEPKTVGQKKVGDKVKASEVEKPEIEGYTYSKTSSDIAIAADESKNVITVTYKQKAGKVGYNLVLADASWTAPEKTTNTEKMKWYFDYGFAKGDTFTVTDSEPTAADHVFIGWMDKKRDDQAAAIRKAGETVTYCYSNNQTYTLDALWASLSATGEDVTYDGKSHTVTVDVKINDGTGLDAKYVEQAKKLITAGAVQYSRDGGETWSAEKPSFKDAGTYTVQVKQDVTVGGETTTLTAETQVKIAQKEYFVKTNTKSKTYDGSELVGTAAVEGLVAGESATATATTVGPNVTASTTNAVTGEIVWAEGTNPSNYKRGNDQLGTLEITKRDVTLTSASDEKTYDGTALTNDTVTVGGDGFVEGEGATYSVTGSQTLVGSSDNKFTYELNSNTKAKNYNITKSAGTLNVKDRDESEKYEITVKGNSTSVTYDGAEHSAAGITDASKTFTNDKGATFTVTANTTDPKSTDVATLENKVSNVKVTDANGDDVTKQFKVKTTNGELTIEKRTVTFTGESKTLAYNGKSQSITGITVGAATADTGLVAGHTWSGLTYEAKGKAPKTYDGAFSGELVIKSGKTDVTKNYKVTKAPGKLTISKSDVVRYVTLTPADATKVYDGQLLAAAAATATDANGNTVKVEYSTDGEKWAEDPTAITATDVTDSKTVYVRASVPDVYEGYVEATQKLTVTPRAITVSAAESKQYTGAQQSFDIPATAATNLADGETLTLAGATIYGTELGSYNAVANDYTWSVAKGEDGSVDSTGNYTISVAGTLTITAIPASEGLTIAPSNKSYVYDSDSHYAAEATATASVAGTKVTLGYRVKGSSDDEWRTYDKSTFSAIKAGTLTLEVRASAPNYDGYAYGEETLTITKRPVELKTKSATKVYDGTALTTMNGYEVGPEKDGGFIFSDLATGSDGYPVLGCTGSQTKVGSSSNTIEYKIKSDRVDCYKVAEPVLGTLTVTAKPISDNDITATAPDDVVYDGQQHQLKPTVKFGETVLKEGEDYDLSWSEDITNAGTVTVTITGKGNYTGTRTVEYKITRRPVTLKSNSRTWTYDGAEHSDATVSVTSELGFVDGEVSDLVANGVVSTVAQGEVANSITFTKNESYKDANYSVTLNEGKLQIAGKGLNAQGMSVGTLQSVVYNGLDQKQTPEVKDGETVLTEGTDYTVEYSKDVKNVGTVTVTVKGKGNYTGSVERTYQITPATLTVTTPSANQVYNGKALTAAGSIAGFVNNETADFKTTGSQKKVGFSANTYSLKWSGSAKESNYTVNETVGVLTVTETAEEVVVTTVGGTYTYDGQVHGATVTVSDLPEGYTLEAAASSASGTDVNNKENDGKGVKVTADTLIIRNADGEDVTSELKVTKHDGYLLIKPAAVTVTTPNASKVYDGTALTAEGTISGLVNGETVNFKTTGSQTAKGESSNTYSLEWSGTAKKSNYTVSEKLGKLVVSKQSIDKDDKDKDSYKGIQIDDPTSAKYDAADHKWVPTVTDANGNKLVEGTDYTVTYKRGDDETTDFKNAGTITVVITGRGNYTGTVTKTYKITKRQVTLTSDSGSKNYDGKPITRHGVTVSGDGFAKGENVSQNYTWFDSDLIEPGTYTNKFEYQLKNGTDANNYEIKTVFGELTINKASASKGIKLTANGASKMYDGQALEAAAATAETKVSGNTVKVEYSVDQKNWTEDPSTITATNVADSKTVYVRASSKNYEGYATAKAKLEVTKRSVKLVGAKNVSKVYDGKELTAPEVEVKGDGFVEGEATDIKATGSVTDVTTAPVANPIAFTKDEGFKAGNYGIETDPGTLEVTARSIDDADYGMDVSKPVDVEYDGLAHQWAPVVKDGELTLTKDRDYTVTYTRDGEEVTDFTNVTGMITVTITGMGNYTGSVIRTYEITPAPLTVTTEGASKVYDGEALTNDVATVGGLKNGETLTIHAVGTQVEVGESDNDYELAWDGTAVESNYSIASEEIGKLVVTETAEQIVATPLDVTVQYDGQAHGTTVQVSSLPKGYTLKSASSKATATNVADGDVTAEVDDLVIVNAEGEDVTSKLDIVRNTATIRITPAPLSVTTGSATKVYDGTALTNSDLKIEGLVGSDSVTAKTTGSRTQVGTAENGYEISWTDADEQNYSITEQLGTLAVTAAPSDNGNGDNGGTTPTPVNPTNNNGGNGNNGGMGGNGIVNTIATALVNGYNAVTGNNATVDAQGTAQAAAQDEEQIFDSENPLGRFEHNELTCWVHWYMILCCAATILYGMFVGLRRNKQTMSLERSLKSILGSSDGSQE